MKEAPAPASTLCKVCRSPRNGKGARGMCHRCYARDLLGKTPSIMPLKRAPGTWKNVQMHMDLELYDLVKAEAKRLRQSIPVWLDGAIRQRLHREKK